MFFYIYQKLVFFLFVFFLTKKHISMQRSNLSFNYFMKYILYVPTFHKGVMLCKIYCCPSFNKIFDMF